MTGVSPNALTGGGDKRASQIISETERSSETSEAPFESSRRDALKFTLNVLKSRSRVRSMSGQTKNTVFTVLALESVRWAAKGSNVPKVLACSRKVLHGNEVSKTTSGHKRHLNKNHKHTVRHMCFLGHFAHRYLYSWSFDHITSFTLTWWSSGQGQIK